MHPKKKFAIVYVLVVLTILWIVCRPVCVDTFNTASEIIEELYGD